MLVKYCVLGLFWCSVQRSIDSLIGIQCTLRMSLCNVVCDICRQLPSKTEYHFNIM